MPQGSEHITLRRATVQSADSRSTTQSPRVKIEIFGMGLSRKDVSGIARYEENLKEGYCPFASLEQGLEKKSEKMKNHLKLNIKFCELFDSFLAQFKSCIKNNNRFLF